ncbi:MAG: hypothetical protein KGJ78_04985 [Alphaproteobacteria bacterium]|nr:hypothetical protein [Alphaproteobacteria bacterium]
MSIDRVATFAQSQFYLAQVLKANSALNTTQNQVSSGKVSDTYAGIGDKTAALEGARSAAARNQAYQSATNLALTQTDLQDTQLTELSNLAQQLKNAVSTAAANADGTDLISTAGSIFQQAKSILNSTDANGNYIYGGQNSDKPPFTATSLADLVSNPISTYFQNGNIAKSVTVGDGQTQQIGVLASDIGTQLMNALASLYTADTPPGSLNGPLTDAQSTNLTDTVMPQAQQAYVVLNTASAKNGDAYKNLQDVQTNQTSLVNLYQGFVSNIEDVDMATAITNLNQNQTALQAALEVTAKLNNLSLLNYLPTTMG